MEWIGIQCIGVHCIPMQFIPGHGAVPTPVRGKAQRDPGPFHYNSGNATNHPEVRSCPAALPAPPNWRRPSAHPTPSTSRACTTSLDRTTAATTSSGPRRPPALSSRSGPAPARWWPCPGSNPSGGVRCNLVKPDQRVHEKGPVPPGLTSITRTVIRRFSDSVSCSSSR